ncbi:MAG: aminopeptidase P N-terminal domain-containing protein [Flavobacteriaceae bacterium]|nr:aminopeptidase P N-terminal domain-containing protein [Flavobacteriaceae bacterium]
MLKNTLFCILALCFVTIAIGQNGNPSDYLSAQFHKERRQAFRALMPFNSVAVFFGNPVRNRANDVDYVYHQDPDFYYLTGYKEPNCVLVLFSGDQLSADGNKYNELIYVQEKNPSEEQWTGIRLGIAGAKKDLGFSTAFNGETFLKSGINFSNFDSVLFKEFKEDNGDSALRDKADLYKLIESFKAQIGYKTAVISKSDSKGIGDVKSKSITASKKENFNTNAIPSFMASLREIKGTEELKLLTKAVRISAIAQREVMKAMHTGMSETEIQGIHEFVYRKYGSEFEGYPSIVGAGNNGCILHYIENSKTKVENDLVLMDVGAEYHGYTADVTRTIPANGKFTVEQKLIYDLVYQAQEAGIAASKVGVTFGSLDGIARQIINKGLLKLGIVKSEADGNQYFPHGLGHHIGLDVHDPGAYNALESNMVITIEPGIYIPNGSNCDKKWWGIGVRIEDDILITPDGPLNLSVEAPRKWQEIEELMKEKSVLSNYTVPNLD